jgi:D-alanyl-lipoteichoic acid acyltransferase DltB (MBOAT superfamily)
VNFIFFLVALLALFYILPKRGEWVLMLAASVIFYAAWEPALLLLLLFIIAVNFVLGRGDKKLLILCLIIDFGTLFIFKYASAIFKVGIILPMGISFYVFQAAAYSIDVFRGKIKPFKNIFKFTLFIAFFPQLVAGPIERAQDLAPQLFTLKKFNLENIVEGYKYLIFGFFKKVVIADRIAKFVDSVYNAPRDREGLALVFATLLFSVQLYCDFSGYSEIAKGAAKMFGVNLMENFKTPYFAGSLKEFWRRWHVSLSSWFKDYVYVPLGGNKKNSNLNLFATFVLSGIWHGANLTFVLWGAFHGAAQIIEKYLIKNRFIRAALTFPLVCFSYIFFRGNNLSDCFYILIKIIKIARDLLSGTADRFSLRYVIDVLSSGGLLLIEVLISLAAIFLLFTVEFCGRKSNIHETLSKKPLGFRFAFYYVITILVFALGVYYDAGAFIYFQF